MGCLLCPGRPWFLALPKQLIRGQMRNEEKALVGPLLQQEEWDQGGGPLAHSPGRGELVSSVGGSGHRMAGLVCPPLRWGCHTGARSVPCSGSSSETAVGFSGLFVSFVHNLPHCTCRQLLLVPYSFFVFVDRGDICPGASTAALPRRGSSPRLPGSPERGSTPLGAQVPGCPAPRRGSTPLFLRGCGPRSLLLDFPLLDRGHRPQPALGVWSSSLSVPGTGGTRAALPRMGWISCVIMSLTSNCWSLKDTNLTRSLNKQGQKREKTTTSIKGPRKRKNQGNCERASLNCWPDRAGGTVLAWLYIFVNLRVKV